MGGADEARDGSRRAATSEAQPVGNGAITAGQPARHASDGSARPDGSDTLKRQACNTLVTDGDSRDIQVQGPQPQGR